MKIKDRSKDVIVSSMDTWKFFDAQSDVFGRGHSS